MTKEIQYSDGDIENEILEALKAAPDVSSSARIAIEKHSSWPFEYHLSSTRANLVRHIEFKGKKVLEIGAGMGAISRYVAENCEYLQIVEGTSRRVACLNERLRDLSNYNVFCGNFSDFKTEEKFDIILVIGVLEYAEVYYPTNSDQNPFVEFLKKVKSHLSSEGKAIIAIENRLGLKYFAGASEDHTGNLFDGILGYKKSKSVRTFSKKELKDILAAAGFEHLEFQYPFPDYKMPTRLLTEQLEKSHPTIFSQMATLGPSRDYSNPEKISLFNESLTTESLSKTGLLSEFSNSFLVTCNSTHTTHIQNKEVAFSYTIGRLINVKTVISQVNPSELIVQKYAFTDPTLESWDYGDIIWQQPPTCAVKELPILGHELSRLYSFNEYEEADRTIINFLNWIFLKYSSNDRTLKVEAWDFHINNIQIMDGEYFSFDNEWVYKNAFSKSWFILRCILNLNLNVLSQICKKYISLAEFYSHLCRSTGTSAQLNIDAQSELNIQSQINNVKIGNIDNYKSFFDRNLFEDSNVHSNYSEIIQKLTNYKIENEAKNSSLKLELKQAQIALDKSTEELNITLNKLNKSNGELSEARRELKNITGSKAWRYLQFARSIWASLKP